MHISRLAKSIVGVERIKVRGIAMDGAGALAIGAEPYRARPCRCGKCGRGAPRCDAGRGVRLWRCCDAGGMKAHVRSEAFRVPCPECGMAAREVPWAAHGPRLTYAFEDTCCRCALSMGRVACQKLMRVSWRTVGSICPGVEARLSGARPPVPGGPVRIGVDEASCRKGCRCMAVIVDHGTGAAVRHALAIAYATYAVRVEAGEEGLCFADHPLGMWDMERYLTLLMGEIPRLEDGPEGYGPSGRGYLVHVDIPDAVRGAWERLSVRYPWSVRQAQSRYAAPLGK